MRRFFHDMAFAALMLAALCAPSAVLCQEEEAENETVPQVGRIKITGNSAFGDKELMKLMQLRPSRMFRSSPFDSQALENDTAAIELYYRDHGFLEARAAGNAEPSPGDSSKVNVEIRVEEGAPTTVSSVRFEGNSTVADTALMNQISLSPEQRYRRGAVDEARIAIQSHYANQGRTDAEIEPDVTIDREAHVADIIFSITENNRFTIGRVVIEGLEKTKREIVTRELTIESGDVIDLSRLHDSQRMIYGTGLFRSVFIRTVDSAADVEGVKDILIEVQEKDSIRLVLSAGYDTVEELRGKCELYTINLFGTARQVGISGRFSFINRSGQVSYTSPRIFDTRWQMDFNGVVEAFEEPSYDLARRTARLTVGRKFRDNSLFRSSFRQERAEAKNIDLTDIPDITRNDISGLELSYRYDSRNSLFNATKGLYFELTGEWGGYVTDKTVSFLRGMGRVRYYHPAHRFTILASSLEAGIIDAEHGLMEIPLQERFYAGGDRSVRGFEYHMLGPWDSSDNPVGGKIKIVWNVLEIRRTIYKSFSMAAFYDIGNIWKNADTFDITDIRQAAGLGARLGTPLGVLRVDYGFNLDPRRGEPSGVLHFSLGQAF